MNIWARCTEKSWIEVVDGNLMIIILWVPLHNLIAAVVHSKNEFLTCFLKSLYICKWCFIEECVEESLTNNKLIIISSFGRS